MKACLHIDRLVLEGLDVPQGGRAALRTAVEQELARLIAAGGLASSLAAGTVVPSVPAPPIAVAPSTKPAQLGAAIAAAVYGGLGGGR